MFDDKVMLDRRDRRTDSKAWTATSARGMVTCAHYRAAEAGARMLAAGGNAIDAAVAAGFALGVVEPAGSGLGGMATMVIHLAEADHTEYLSGPCRAPLAATPDQFVVGQPRKTGYRAIAVPTHVATLAYALNTWGTKEHDEVLVPAIELARDGHAMTPLSCKLLSDYRDAIAAGTAGPLLLDGGTDVPPVGSIRTQPVLARTLQRMADNGFEEFYQGEIAEEIIADMAANGGFVSGDDLFRVPWPTQLKPTRARFHDCDVVTAGPPAGGVTLVHMLNLLTLAEKRAGRRLDPECDPDILAYAGLIRRARRDRRKYGRLGEAGPDRASIEFAQESFQKMKWRVPKKKKGADSPPPSAPTDAGRGETSHISVIDGEGNAVALTQSIERSFGSKCATASLGFVYNGYMQGFKVEDEDHPHFLRPGAVARSNASPTMLMRDGRVQLVIGNTGSERMASAILGAIARYRDRSPFEAVAAPRLHCTPEDVVLIELDRFAPDLRGVLETAGFTIDAQDPYAFKFGGMHVIVRDGDNLIGVADPRRDGAAAGPDETSG